MVFTIIAAMTSLHVGVCLLSYCKALHDRWWHFPVGLGLALLNNILCFVAHGDKELYFLSSCVFVGVPALYFGLHLALEETKSRPFDLIAIGFIALGLALLCPKII